jgi:hypothetical protein
MLVEERLVARIGDRALETAVRRTIRKLQALKDPILSGDDSGLTNAWDEFCAQVQFEESHYWPVYVHTAKAVLTRHIETLPVLDVSAAWLRTDPGFDWVLDNPEAENPIPVVIDGDRSRVSCPLRKGERMVKPTNPRLR